MGAIAEGLVQVLLRQEGPLILDGAPRLLRSEARGKGKGWPDICYQVGLIRLTGPGHVFRRGQAEYRIPRGET